MDVQIIPDEKGMRYDLLVECREGMGDRAKAFAEAFDRHLGEINIEYLQKRGSARLGAPRVVRMRTG